MKLLNLLLFIVFSCIILFSVNAYKVENGTEVHQYISKESLNVCSYLPYEIKNNANKTYNLPINGKYLINDDDLITGSGEEDKDIEESTIYFNRNHFWDVDRTKYYYESRFYDQGLWDRNESDIESSYTKAKRYWDTKVIYYYLHGDIAQSYYWLGMVSHLLEDSTVPAHMHLDPHLFDDSVEDYTGTYFRDYPGV